MRPETIKIDEVEYIRKDSVQQKAKDCNGWPYVIIRASSSGVHAGFLVKNIVEQGLRTVTLYSARRIFYWDGAASLSQMAVDGVSKPENCKFPCAVEEIQVSGVIEVIPCTLKAQQSILGVAIWKR